MLSLIFLAALAAGPASTAANADSQKIVCKSTRVVGSNMGQRTCKTKEKWAEDREKGREGTSEALERERGYATPCMNGGSLVGGNCGGGN